MVFYCKEIKRFQRRLIFGRDRGLLAKPFQGGILGSSREGKIRGIVPHLPFLHDLKDRVLNLILIRAQGPVEIVSRRTALRTMGFVDDYSKLLVGKIFDAINDEGELLDSGDHGFSWHGKRP